MTKRCIICKKESLPAGHNIRSFHMFPEKDVMKIKWMLAIGISKISKHATICSDHFEEHAYHQTDGYTHRRRLLRDAIPSINLDPKVPCTVDIKSHQPISSTVFHIDSIPTMPIENSKQVCDTTTKSESEDSEEGFTNENSDMCPCNSIGSSCDETIQGGTNILRCTSNHKWENKDFEEGVTNGCSDIFPCNTTASSCDGTIQGETDILKCTSLRKRKHPLFSKGACTVRKKICFTNSYQAEHISREDFASDEAWEKFIRFYEMKCRQLNAKQQENFRKDKLIHNMKYRIMKLREANAVPKY